MGFSRSIERGILKCMPRNVYWELYYHFVWRTKDSQPMQFPAK